MPNRVRNKKGKSKRARASPVDYGKWFTPSPTPPTIKEQKWKTARLKLQVAAAGDSGAVEIFNPVRLREIIGTQQRLPAPTAVQKMLVRVKSVFSYALPGIAESGTQAYPSTKIYVYDLGNLANAATNWSMDTRESAGTLNHAARIGYAFPRWMQSIPILTEGSVELFKVENYHAARGYIYIDMQYCYTDE